jgi:hypothetical protein
MISASESHELQRELQAGRRQSEQIRQTLGKAETEAERRKKREVERAFKSVGEHWENKGKKFDGESARELLAKKGGEPEPSLPYLILWIALLMDALDMLSLTLVMKFVLLPLEVLFWIIFTLWFMGKMSGRWWKKGLIKWLLKRCLIPLVEIFVPGLDFLLPGQTIMVLMAHYRHKGIVILINESLEILHKHKVV